MDFLLQGSDFVIEVIWLAIILIAGLFTWVKKIIEKKLSEGRGGEPGKKVDVGSAVRAQIEKYMRAAEGSRIGRQVGAIPEAEEPPPRPAAPLARPTPPVAMPAPQPMAVARAAREIESRAPLGAAPAYSASFGAGTAAALSLRGRTPRRVRIRLTRMNVKSAVVLAEVLGPPVGMRPDYRLF